MRLLIYSAESSNEQLVLRIFSESGMPYNFRISHTNNHHEFREDILTTLRK